MYTPSELIKRSFELSQVPLGPGLFFAFLCDYFDSEKPLRRFKDEKSYFEFVNKLEPQELSFGCYQPELGTFDFVTEDFYLSISISQSGACSIRSFDKRGAPSETVDRAELKDELMRFAKDSPKGD